MTILTSLSRRMFLVGAAAMMVTRPKFELVMKHSKTLSIVDSMDSVASFIYEISDGEVLQIGDAVTFDRNGRVMKADITDRIIGYHYGLVDVTTNHPYEINLEESEVIFRS